MEASTRKPKVNLSSTLTTEEKYVVRGNRTSVFCAESTLEDLKTSCGTEDIKVLDIPELVSDELKVLIYVHDKFYHFFADTLPFILKLHKIDPAIRFVIYVKKSKQINSEPFLEVLFDLLKWVGAKWTLLESVYEDEFFPACKIRNFVRTDEHIFNLHAALSLKDVAESVQVLQQMYSINAGGSKPWRKVYLSYRSGSNSEAGFGDVYTADGSYPDDTRLTLENAEKLEQYFFWAGFEIVNPELEFVHGGIAEQIKFMSEVAVLASVSSSGLANSLFMPKGGLVVELATEVVVPTWIDEDGLVRTKQEIPLEFYALSYGMGQTHLMIPTNRNASAAIKELKKLEGLLTRG